MLKEELLRRLNKVRLTRAKKLGYELPEDIIRKNEKPLYEEGVSIILPTYKGEALIQKCLESLASQTLDPSLFEVIVVINGEKDNSEKLINQLIDD
jgi:cellulose synthase/poly-beta-1,6-N-acetylglucosamine synthase-like glycosyltransferase